MMRRLLACATVAAVAELSVIPAATVQLPSRRPPDFSPLTDECTFERRLARGDDHRYQLSLKPGERVRVSVEQRGIDLVVQTRDAAGHPIAEFDDDVRPRGEESIDLVADAAGTYTLAITASPLAGGSGSYAIHVADRRAATDADRAMQQSRRLRTAAAELEANGRFAAARSLLERALSLSERVRGPDAADAGLLLFRLAGNAQEMRDDPRAQAFDERAIAIFDKTWGADHPYSAKARGLMAALFQHAGRGPAADMLLRSALAILENTVGTDHRWYAQCLLTQAIVRFDAGDFDRAEDIDRRAIGILERIQDVDGITYGALLNNLGEVYLRNGDTAHAEDLFRRSLAVDEQREGPDSFRVSTSLQNLGIVERDRGEYAKALESDARALAIRERILGPDHPDIAPLLNNLAILYHVTGDDARSLSSHFRALAIREKTVGPYHRGTLNSVGNIARTYASMGETEKAIAFERRADAIVETQLALNVAVGSERQKLAFVRSVSERTDRTISLHLFQAPRDPDASALAALVLLQRKGRVQDAMADVFAAVSHRIADAGDRALMDRLNQTRTRLSQLALNAAAGAGEEDRERELAELESRKEQLEATLSEHSAAFRAETQTVTVAAVQAAIPADAALLEFAVFRPFDPKAERNADAYGPARYAAYVVRRHAAPIGVDLGEVAVIDRWVDALRDGLRSPSGDVQSAARELDARVMAPLRAALAGATRLIISPDGHLNLVPFEALIGEDGRYLLERYATTYVTSGRDLLRMQIARRPSTPPVIVADPLFGEPAPRDTGRVATFGARVGRTALTTGANLSSVYFSPLAATGAEGRSIKALFPDAALFTGARATKATLLHVNAPRILHIASHGFFLDDDARGAPATSAQANPLLRSGLAFAGANLTPDGQGDGILTALEASGLDLWGTKLVTLSACDTGVGEIRNGEGVYGLRRAFVLAGAETLVMSLWPISDYLARDTMVAYYTGLRAGLGRGDALRQAKLAMLRRPSRRHPYYWAGFIQSGEWADLNGRR